LYATADGFRIGCAMSSAPSVTAELNGTSVTSQLNVEY
jgi:hypothetical protein